MIYEREIENIELTYGILKFKEITIGKIRFQKISKYKM